jgi:GNAT superfamily N-acetyltransferase
MTPTSIARRVRIRAAEPSDAALVHRMVLEIAEHEDSIAYVRSSVSDWTRMLARPDVTVLLAVDGDEALGYASTTRRLHLWSGGDVLALDDLYVREAARNLGVGRQLMAAVAGLAAPDGLTVVWGARLDNEDGHRFYRRLGASLSTKVMAVWSPDDYGWAVRPSAQWE